MQDRKTLLKWCKDRAIELAEKGQLKEAVSGFIRDVQNNEETLKLSGVLPILFMHVATDIRNNNKQRVIKWINDFA